MKHSSLLLLCCALLFGCSGGNDNARLKSNSINSAEERVAILSPLITTPTAILDAEYDLFNVNGFGGERITIPGASSSNYAFVVKIAPNDLAAWTKGFSLVENAELPEWGIAIPDDRKANWDVSTPTFYSRKAKNNIMIVYANEGIIFKKVVID